MPNTREKLIGILETVVDPVMISVCGEVPVSTARVADHLIANGVTVQEWISVKDRLPEYGKRVLTFGSRDGQLYVYIDQICGDGGWLFATWEVTHWMPLPQPPKGE